MFNADVKAMILHNLSERPHRPSVKLLTGNSTFLVENEIKYLIVSMSEIRVPFLRKIVV